MKTKSVESQSSVGLAERKPKASKWAKTSFWCGLLSLGLPIGILLFVDSLHWLLPPLSFSARRTLEEMLGRMLVIGSPMLAITALVSGVVGLVRINLKKGAVKGTGKAVGGILLSLLFFALALGVMMLPRVRHIAGDTICRKNLSTLGKAMRMYAADYDGRYPTANEWCDLLIEYADVHKGHFVCAVSETERAYYAINPNAEPDSPGDMVLLFESYGGWNQFGGPEKLTTGNHFRNRCNILFNDGHVEFVKPKRIGELKWKVEESGK